MPDDARGIWSIELVDCAEIAQSYADNTAVLVTRMIDRAGAVVEITDCAPRFVHHGRLHQPMTIARRIKRLTGSPRVIVHLRPAFQYGRSRPTTTTGSHHIRYVGPDLTLRLTTDASITAVLEERPLFVEDTVTLLLGADETIPDPLAELGRSFVEETLAHTVMRPRPPRPAALVEPLTPRESEVLQLLAQGLPNKAIAERLRISDHTAKFHVNAILGKLGAQTRTEAIVHAARLGLVLL